MSSTEQENIPQPETSGVQEVRTEDVEEIVVKLGWFLFNWLFQMDHIWPYDMVYMYGQKGESGFQKGPSLDGIKHERLVVEKGKAAKLVWCSVKFFSYSSYLILHAARGPLDPRL